MLVSVKKPIGMKEISSIQLAKMLITDKVDLTVELDNGDLTVYLEIHDDDKKEKHLKY